MRTFSRVMVIGRVGRDVEVRLPSHANGTAWASMSVATTRARKDGDAWIEETDWHAVRLFGRDAEYAAKSCRRGSLVAVEGALAYERFVDAQGNKRVSVRVVADRVSLLAHPPDRAAEGEAVAPTVATEEVAQA